MKAVTLTEAAVDEFTAAAEWYESRRVGLGESFVAAVDETVSRIAETPSAFPLWNRDSRFRTALLARFPFVVFFREGDEVVVVIAIAHCRRKPGYWLGRAEKR